jgi:hypothetical protein
VNVSYSESVVRKYLHDMIQPIFSSIATEHPYISAKGVSSSPPKRMQSLHASHTRKTADTIKRENALARHRCALETTDVCAPAHRDAAGVSLPYLNFCMLLMIKKICRCF